MKRKNEFRVWKCRLAEDPGCRTGAQGIVSREIVEEEEACRSGNEGEAERGSEE